MNLKEAFRFQNKLSMLLDSVDDFLSNGVNMLEIKENHLRHKAMAEHDNETVFRTDSEFQIITKPECVIDLGMFLIDEKEKLAAAILETKKQLSIDIDGQTAINSFRHRLTKNMLSLTKLRSNEELIRNYGTGYCFNKDGNQVQYHYDIERITTLNYDRNKAKRLMLEVSEKAESVSTAIDECMVSAAVDYTPPFNINCDFLELATEFQDKMS